MHNLEGAMAEDKIKLRAVKTNNLKNIDAVFELNQTTVVTGVSGSGKSSLVFETLYGEAYRRYVSSLSSYARQFLKVLPRPDMEGCENLPPAVSVQQSRGGSNYRSTVGSLTELADLLKMMFVKVGHIICSSCGKQIRKDDPRNIYLELMAQKKGERIVIAAEAEAWSSLNPTEIKKQLLAQGFSRVILNGEFVKLEQVATQGLSKALIVVDRLKLVEENRDRIMEGFEVALRLGRGEARAVDDQLQSALFSDRLECCGTTYVMPSQALLSYNHPYGACTTCHGYGREAVIDWEKVFPNKEKSIKTKGVAPLNFGKHSSYYATIDKASAVSAALFKKPFSDYKEADWELLKHGDGQKFEGVQGYFKWLDSKKYKPHYRMHAARFRKYVTCSSCKGDRLNDLALAIRVRGSNLADISKKSTRHLLDWFGELQANWDPNKLEFMAEVLDEGTTRLDYLCRVGLGYLSMNRAAPTLSGGELQRIHMARCLGSALTQTLFCLDEPTVGLHARDVGRLVGVMKDLQNLGNTLVIVEHDFQVMQAADKVMEIGPAAGHLGGEVTFQGKIKSRKELKSYAEVDTEKTALTKQTAFLDLKGARTHNLKSVDVRIPIGKFSAVSGVSGSGKTSLIQHTLYPLVCEQLGQEVEVNLSPPDADGLLPKKLDSFFSEALLVGQQSLGRSSRSNIATYLDVYSDIRNLMAKASGSDKITPGLFSFNTPGGRCEECQGLGKVEEDLSFLGDMKVTCTTCQGKRFKDSVLKVTYLGKNLIDILNMTVLEAKTFFDESKKIKNVLEQVVKIGLGYLTLGQSTSSFSGGEAQRLKLLKLLTKAKRGEGPKLLILDEPTAGLSNRDVTHLLRQFTALCERGHTVVVIEHNLDVIKAADWVLDIGPDAAHNGGDLVYQGPPENLKQQENSATAVYL